MPCGPSHCFPLYLSRGNVYIPIIEPYRGQLFRKMRALSILIIGLTLIAAHLEIGHAQVLPFRQYSVVDGLSGNNVRALSQDARGYLWIGTADGLCSFDGTTFRRYGGEDGLTFAFVNAVAVSKHRPESIWVATNGGGVFLLQEGKFRQYRMGGGGYSERVNALSEDREGTLWCATDDGVYLVDRERLSRFRPEEIVEEIFDLCWQNDSTLWILGKFGPRVYFRNSGRILRIRPQLRASEMLGKLLCDTDGDVWVGGMIGTLIRYHDFREAERLSLGGYAAPQLDDGEGRIWVDIPEGIMTIAKRSGDLSRTSRITSANGLGIGSFGPIFRDKENNIWVGGVGHGLYKLENQTTVQFPIHGPDGTGRATGNGVDRMWTATGGTLQELYRGGDGVYRLHSTSLGDRERFGSIAHHALDENGNLWVVFARGEIREYLMRNRPGMPSGYALVQAMQVSARDEIPVYLYFDHQQRVWCSITEVGTYLIDPSVPRKEVRLLTTKDGLPDNGIRTITQDAQGRMWFGGYSHGAVRMEIASHGMVRPGSLWSVPGLPDLSVRAILQTIDSTCWIGTRYGGLVWMGHGSSGILTIGDGLPSNTVWSLADDGAGGVWAGTSQGFARILPGNPPVVQRLEESAGKPIYSVGVLQDGHVWGFSDDGFILYDPSKARPNTVPPTIFLTRVEVNGTQRAFAGGLDLPNSLNNIGIEFLGISLHGSRPVRYQYRLDGADDDWHEPTLSRFVAYAALSPGRYVFRVRAINADGVPSATPATCGFIIHPPLWMTWWFLLLAVVLCGLTGVLIVRVRMRRIRAIERVRSQIASDLHDDVGAGLTRITLFSDTAMETLVSRPVGRAGRREGKARALLGEISATSRELVDSMSDIVWAVDPKSDSFDDVLLRMKSYAGRVLEAKHIDYAIDIPHAVARLKLPLQFRRNVFLMFKEAMTNILRHSAARTVRISVALQNKSLVMTIADDGIGFDPAVRSQGNGIRNLHRRSALIGGNADIESRPGEGTRITVRGRIP